MIKWIVTVSVSDLEDDMAMLWYPYLVDTEKISIQFLEEIFSYFIDSVLNI